jgi:hypothetical protein
MPLRTAAGPARLGKPNRAALTSSPCRGIFEMKIIVGMILCVIGIIVWVAPLGTTLIRAYPTVVSLGVIIGGVIIMSGIALICLPNYRIKITYFDKGP